MTSKSFLAAVFATPLLCAALPAHSQQKPVNLPDGPGKDAVATYCSGCHGLSRVVASGYPQAYWHTTIRMMLNFGVPIPQDQVIPMIDYLAKNFPERPMPVAKIIPGPAQVNIREWQVPTPGSRPHDPLATRDGAIWYTGQLANKLGRVDPKTGQIREYTLKTPQTAPHGLVEDREGNIWFTGNHTSVIGKLDPKTGAVTEYPMPDPNAKDPHSLAFDQSDILWFTLQQSNMMARLDPRSGEIKLITSPTPRSRPYGIIVNSKGIPFVALFGTNKIAAIDPQTLAVREYALPDPKARPRRIAITGDDIVWFSDFARGYLGRLDPATGEVKEWASPSGPRSQPYGIVYTKGAVWYNESGTKPNTIVRFDPQTQQFQSWVIPSGGYIVRKMDVNPDGNPVMVNSTVNFVGMVEVK
jgi:virginiamycin B lyase